MCIQENFVYSLLHCSDPPFSEPSQGPERFSVEHDKLNNISHSRMQLVCLKKWAGIWPFWDDLEPSEGCV